MATDYNLLSIVSADALILDRRQGIGKHTSSDHHPHTLFLNFKTVCLIEAFIDTFFDTLYFHLIN